MRRASAELRKTLSSNLRSYRQEKGLSQEELAHMCGLHRTYIGSVERCERNVTLSTLEKLASALGRSVVDILTPAGGPDAPNSEGSRLQRGNRQ